MPTISTMRLLRIINLLSRAILCSLAFSSCAMPNMGQEHARPKWQVAEIITVEQQALEEVMSVSPNFTLPFGEESAAAARARMFIQQYAGKIQEKEVSSNDLSSKAVQIFGDSAHYRFVVQRETLMDGIRYTVRCLPLNTTASDKLAEQNARNLSRFIRNGQLEVSLLDL